MIAGSRAMSTGRLSCGVRDDGLRTRAAGRAVGASVTDGTPRLSRPVSLVRHNVPTRQSRPALASAQNLGRVVGRRRLLEVSSAARRRKAPGAEEPGCRLSELSSEDLVD
jgi:hypothetical protein